VYNLWKRASNLRERSPHAGVACSRARCPKEVNDEAHIAQHRCIIYSYSMTAETWRFTKESGSATVRPSSVFAIASSYFVGCCTGRSDGFSLQYAVDITRRAAVLIITPSTVAISRISSRRWMMPSTRCTRPPAGREAHQNQRSSFVELRRGFAASRQGDARGWDWETGAKTAETSSTCRVMNRVPGPSVI
jgi:hypothetical protein